MRRGITSRRGRRPGFTLVEILVVVTILGIMAGMLMPVFVRAQENAKLARCMSHLKQIGEACIIYMSDYNETFPVAFTYKDPGEYKDEASPRGQAIGGQTAGFSIRDSSLPYEYLRPLWKYTQQSRKIWECPNACKIDVPGVGQVTDYQWYGNSYPMNLVFGTPPGVVGARPDGSLIYTLAGVEQAPYTWRIGRRLSTVSRPTKIILFAERSICQYSWAGREDPAFAGRFRYHDNLASRTPVCFVDGHVKYVLITGDHQVTVGGRTLNTYGLWDRDWAMMESGWIQERPDIGLPLSM